MTKTKSTKRALLTSALALLMCVSMLIGSTFAWFTDSATSGVNTIQAGTLDIVLEYLDGNEWKNAEGITLNFKKAAGAPAGEAILWEPGCTYELPAIRVRNNGNLALKYNMVINGIDGDAKLLEAIEFTANGASITNFSGNLIAKDEASAPIVIKGHMKEEAGNEYQGLSIGGIGITVVATQLTSEFDSFDNQYDKGAAWDGVVPTEKPETLVVDGATQTVHVKDAAAFAYLSTLSADWSTLHANGGSSYIDYANGAGADYYYSGKWTVSLEADINLMNYPIEPVVIKFGTRTGASAFRGNGHVISNINTTTGLFADNSWAHYADLTLENVKATNGALAGAAYDSNISNVTVKNATISGENFVGGLVGYHYGDITGCQVIDSTVTGNEDAGGLTGYNCQENGSYTVSNNKVQNVSVSAKVRAAGLIATANITGEVCNNTLDNVTVVAAEVDTDGHKADIISSWNLVGNVQDNTVNNCKVGREVYGLTLFPNGENSQIIVSDKEGFLNLTKLFADWTALFTDGNGTDYINYFNGAGVDYYYGGRWTIVLDADIDLNNATIAPVIIKHPKSAGAPSFEGNNHTIKNAKIVTNATTENEAGLFNTNYVTFKNLKLDNIHVIGSNVGNSTAGVLSGSVNADQGVQNITITNSSVTGGKYTGGVIGYGYTDVLNCTLTNVTVKGGYKLGGLVGYICASGTNTGDVTGNTLTDCTVDGIGDGVFAGGKDKYVIGQVVGNYDCNGTCNNNTITGMTSSVTDAIGEIESGKTVTQ